MYVKDCFVLKCGVAYRTVSVSSDSSASSITENNIHVHDLLTFQQITVVSKAKGATLFACDLQVHITQSF